MDEEGPHPDLRHHQQQAGRIPSPPDREVLQESDPGAQDDAGGQRGSGPRRVRQQRTRPGDHGEGQESQAQREGGRGLAHRAGRPPGGRPTDFAGGEWGNRHATSGDRAAAMGQQTHSAQAA